MANTGKLAGKVCVISGAAFGIGRGAAEVFAEEGAKLVMNDIQAGPLDSAVAAIRAMDAEAIGVVGDVSRDADVQTIIQTAIDQFGRLDVVVANAGIIPLGDVTEMSGDDFDQVMAIDGRGMYLTCKYAIQAMLKGGGGGSIVCLSSISGEAGQARQAVYGPAKFVASGITKHLAIEWAAQGIRVNAVAPGTINTERVQQLPNEPGGAEYLENIKKLHPMGRIGDPKEVGRAIAFLASDEASFITGVVLPVDGGYLAQ